jgi:radical SAM protein (TIGR01212 family)
MRRFNAYADYFKKLYGERVQKLTIDAGFTCPNRDGKVAIGGCAYCNNDAFNPSYCMSSKSVTRQLMEGIEFHRKRYRKADQYLAYFQAYSNTYAPVSHLRAVYEEALSIEGVVGLVIGTRPDCVGEEVLDYLSELNNTCHVVVEYGVESCYDRTLRRINRGHTFAQSVDAIERTAQRNIRIGVHLIMGLPGESHQEMLDEATIISRLPIDTVKLHQLQIPVGTAFAAEYAADPTKFALFGMDEYIDFAVHFLERLHPSLVVERFAGEMPPRYMAAPGWGSIRNVELWRLLEQRLEALDTWQGRLYEPQARTDTSSHPIK